VNCHIRERQWRQRCHGRIAADEAKDYKTKAVFVQTMIVVRCFEFLDNDEIRSNVGTARLHRNIATHGHMTGESCYRCIDTLLVT